MAEGHVQAPGRALALLAGDLYAAPQADQRGATGDVRPVWEAFSATFASVAGVNGNHDTFGEQSAADFAHHAGVQLLDGEVRTLLGLRVGGVGGIVGKPTKPNRKSEAHFQDLLARVLRGGADVVLLHQGPDGPGERGSPTVRTAIEAVEAPPLVAFGHCHWAVPFYEVGRRQLLNVDGRVVVLRRD